MKKFTTIVLAMGISACVSNVEQTQSKLSQGATIALEMVEKKVADCELTTATEYLMCWGQAYDQALLAANFPTATTIPLRTQFGLVGEAFDRGEITPNEVDLHISEIKQKELVGAYNEAMSAARHRDEQQAKAFTAMADYYQKQQAIEAYRVQQYRPRPATSFNCRNHAYGMNCNGY